MKTVFIYHTIDIHTERIPFTTPPIIKVLHSKPPFETASDFVGLPEGEMVDSTSSNVSPLSKESTGAEIPGVLIIVLSAGS